VQCSGKMTSRVFRRRGCRVSEPEPQSQPNPELGVPSQLIQQHALLRCRSVMQAPGVPDRRVLPLMLHPACCMSGFAGPEHDAAHQQRCQCRTHCSGGKAPHPRSLPDSSARGAHANLKLCIPFAHRAGVRSYTRWKTPTKPAAQRFTTARPPSPPPHCTEAAQAQRGAMPQSRRRRRPTS
jgi:hypothetical protein